MTSDWSQARAAHRRSIEEFVAAARAVPAARWESPIAEGKWSPAQVAEHLRLTYEVIGRELAGGAGLRQRTSWWLRLILRRRFLPAILARGAIPAGARAPKEARPGPGPYPQAIVLPALEELSTRAEAAIATRRPRASGTFTHHIFGRLNAGDALRFATVHNEHHRRQIAGTA